MKKLNRIISPKDGTLSKLSLPDEVTARSICIGDKVFIKKFFCGADAYSKSVEEKIQNNVFNYWKNNRKKKNKNYLNVLLAEYENELIGVQAYFPYPDEDGLAGSWLLGVNENWRRQGIGAYLKKNAMEHASSKGAIAMESLVKLDNHPMNSLNLTWKAQKEEDPEETGFYQTIIKL